MRTLISTQNIMNQLAENIALNWRKKG